MDFAKTLSRLTCCALIALLAGCVPIGIRGTSISYIATQGASG